jgi:hypothetical protein
MLYPMHMSRLVQTSMPAGCLCPLCRSLPSCVPVQAAWKPKPVSLNIPANTKPVRIVLEGTPLLKGMLVLTGCRCVVGAGQRLPLGGHCRVGTWSAACRKLFAYEPTVCLIALPACLPARLPAG